MNEKVAFLIGDSISMGYYPLVRDRLAGRVHVVRHEGNGGTSANVRARLAEWLGALRPDVIHFNAGLHDLARDQGLQGPNRVPLADYEDNLRWIVSWLKANTSARLVWATTTPVVDEWHAARKGFFRLQADVERYNAAARRILEAQGVPINDIFAVIERLGRTACLLEDGVHMNDRGNEALAEAVAAALLRNV